MSDLSTISEVSSSGANAGIVWEKLGELLRYQQDAPMLFSTGLFFFLFIVFFAVYRSLRQATTARIVYVTLFSLYFYYKSSGLWFVLLIFTATSDFLIARAIAQTSRKGLRKAWVALSVCINIGMLAYFKYTNFLYDLGVMLLSSIGPWIGKAEWAQMTYSSMDIFLPVSQFLPATAL